MAAVSLSVVIRAKDEAASIGQTLDLLARQTVPAQVIVVDSGSRDATRHIARAAGARVIEIPAESFTFGGALNTGCAAATGDVVVALSAHAFPRDDGWLERMAAAFVDPLVCAATGDTHGPERDTLCQAVVQDEALARRHPLWGYSNHAGGFRRALWEQRGFRADLPATEDKEWAWHWLTRGYTVVVARELMVDHSHLDDPLPVIFEHARRSAAGSRMYLDLPPLALRELVGVWWADQESYRSPWRARLKPRRIAELAGRYWGRR